MLDYSWQLIEGRKNFKTTSYGKAMEKGKKY
jgi:hypothetical protein